jgi:hypothetical protein
MMKIRKKKTCSTKTHSTKTKTNLIFLQFFIFLSDFTTQQIMNKFVCAEKNNDSCLILVRWTRISFYIFPSTSGSWDNPQWIFQKHWKCPLWVAWDRDHKVYYEIKEYVVSLVLSLVFKTVFGMFLAHLICLKSVK